MKVLITGGAGFIGSHLCERLLARGDDVTAADSLITGRENNLAELVDSPHFHFRRLDVSSPLPDDLDGSGQKFAAIYHLASPASPRGYLDHPLETALANSAGTHNVLKLARASGAAFLLASTSETYGDPLVHPQTEDYWGNVNPVGVRACYDESKRFAEAITMIYVRQFGVDARIVRIFNCYGPRSDPEDGRMVPNFVTQAILGRPITIYDGGQRTRSLCYVSDLVDGLMKVMETAGTTGRVYNLGNPDERTVLEFAHIIKRLAQSPSEITFVPGISTDDPSRRCPDISRAQSELGWEPVVSLEDGLQTTIDWFRGLKLVAAGDRSADRR